MGSRIEDAATAAAVPIQRAANNLWDANAQITRDLAREGFTEDREPYRIPNPAAAGPGVAPTIVEPNRSRPNAARYASRANELAAAEAARRVLYATNGTCDNARDQLATWLRLDAAAADTNQSVEFKHLVDAMNATGNPNEPAPCGTTRGGPAGCRPACSPAPAPAPPEESGCATACARAQSRARA